MTHDLSLLANIAIALLTAFCGGILARTLKLPTMIGYLLAGVAIGPFTPGFVGHLGALQQLAELGIIFLMFGVGLHFSIRDLWTVRRIAIPGAVFQMVGVTLIVTLLAPLFGWSIIAGVFMGLALSIASTVVMLRNLMDQGVLNTAHGQIAVGWLVLEDLITVLILVLLPNLITTTSEPLWQTVALAILKAGLFAAGMLVVGTRVIPWALARIVHFQSRELFVIAIVLLTVGTALSASAFFGVSLALGAFLAGVVVSESALAHQVNAEMLPFRDLFTVLFFVSVGMLINPMRLWQAFGVVLVIAVLIVPGKYLFTLLLSLLLTRSTRTSLILAAGRSQIGEFSFLLGSLGIGLGILSEEQYSLLLAGAMISITCNPFLFRALPWLERQANRLPMIAALTTAKDRVPPMPMSAFQNHVITIGYGRVGSHLVEVLGRLGLARLVVDLDLQRIQTLESQGIAALYGDAANSEILAHAQVELARAVAITVPDEVSAGIITSAIRQRTKTVPIVVRAATSSGVQTLLQLGATDVIHPELEGGLNVVRQALQYLGCELTTIEQYTDAVRRHHYDATDFAQKEQTLNQLRVSTAFSTDIPSEATTD